MELCNIGPMLLSLLIFQEKTEIQVFISNLPIFFLMLATISDVLKHYTDQSRPTCRPAVKGGSKLASVQSGREGKRAGIHLVTKAEDGVGRGGDFKEKPKV